MRVGCCPVPSVPFPRTATQEKPHGRFPFPPSPLPGGPGWEGGSCTMDWEPAAPPLTPKRALSGPRAPTLPPNSAPQPVPRHGPVPPPASALPQPHPMGPSITQPALAPWQPPPACLPAPAPPGPLRWAGRDVRLWLWVLCRDGTLPLVPPSHPKDGICGFVRVTQSQRGTESIVMGARLLHR